MIIEVNPNWRIRSDPHCWSVQHREVSKTGKVKWRSLTYWKDPDGALQVSTSTLFDGA